MARNLALVGCGAISQAFYLPALVKRRDKFDRICLVDPNDRVLSVATGFLEADTAHSLAEVDHELAFVIIATPNALHFPLACEALARNAHVLIEKPFVLNPEHGRVLAATAAARHRIVAINQTRRLSPVTRELCQKVWAGDFGALVAVEHFEGVKLNWPFESGAAFARNAERTGVIMDFGVHVLDFYQFLLRPQWEVVSVIHDGFHGPEGLAEISLTASGVPVSIRLSRYHTQDNVFRMTFEKAEVRAGIFDWNTYSVRPSSGGVNTIATGPTIFAFEQLAENLLMNFLEAADAREPALCDAASSLPVIELLDDIYRRATHYPAAIGAV